MLTFVAELIAVFCFAADCVYKVELFEWAAVPKLSCVEGLDEEEGLAKVLLNWLVLIDFFVGWLFTLWDLAWKLSY